MAGCPSPDCEEKSDVVDMSSWQLLAPAEDPFAPPADVPLCSVDDIRMEPFDSSGLVVLDVDTRAGCGWATLAQDTRTELVTGDVVFSRLFYFSQTAFPNNVADVALRLGDEDVWRIAVPIPTSSKLEFPSVTLERDVPAGSRVLFHIGNHGDNSWNLLEVSRVRKVFCPLS